MSQSLRIPEAPESTALDDYCPVCGRPHTQQLRALAQKIAILLTYTA
jgi:hypothetical protein